MWNKIRQDLCPVGVNSIPGFSKLCQEDQDILQSDYAMTEAGTIETFALKNNLSRIVHEPISTFSDSMVGLGELKQMNAFRCVDDSDSELTDEEELAAELALFKKKEKGKGRE